MFHCIRDSNEHLSFRLCLRVEKHGPVTCLQKHGSTDSIRLPFSPRRVSLTRGQGVLLGLAHGEGGCSTPWPASSQTLDAL